MIRLIKPEEVPAQLEKFRAKYPWAPEPQWTGVLVEADGDDKIVAIAEIQVRVLVATVDGDTPRATADMMAAVDGWLCGRGYNQYEFEVPNHNKKFQKFIEGPKYKMKPVKRLPHRLYLVRRT